MPQPEILYEEANGVNDFYGICLIVPHESFVVRAMTRRLYPAEFRAAGDTPKEAVVNCLGEIDKQIMELQKLKGRLILSAPEIFRSVEQR